MNSKNKDLFNTIEYIILLLASFNAVYMRNWNSWGLLFIITLSIWYKKRLINKS